MGNMKRVVGRSLLAVFLTGFAVVNAVADEPADVFFKEGVWGGLASGENAPALLLPGPKLAVSFHRLDGVVYSAADAEAMERNASLSAFVTTTFQGIYLRHALPKLELTSDEAITRFHPDRFARGELAVFFADIDKDAVAIKRANDAAYEHMRKFEPGMTVETFAIPKCGLYLLRNGQNALGAILLVAPNERREIARFCVDFATLQTLGFRGNVKSLTKEQCRSVRCLPRPKTAMSRWDMVALAALYDVEKPTFATSRKRFQELLQSLP